MFLLILLSTLILLSGLMLIINPVLIFGFLARESDKAGLHLFAVLVRLLLGALLLYFADASKFPLAIEIIGWISIIAAVAFVVMGRSNFKKLMKWALSFQNDYGRLGGFAAAVFGGFLIYAFV